MFDLPIIAVMGNPNVGKSSLFNLLTGDEQKIANYPGVTVERHEGELELPNKQKVTLIDLPGTYSLNALTEDEEVAIKILKGEGQRAPDLVLVVLEATKINRCLLLLKQVQTVHSKVIAVVNMLDEWPKDQKPPPLNLLALKLNCPVVGFSARAKTGVQALLDAIQKSVSGSGQTLAPALLATDLAATYKLIDRDLKDINWNSPGALPQKLDKIFLHKYFGPVLFLLVMFLLFQTLFTLAAPLMDAVETVLSVIADWAGSYVTHPVLKSLLADGLIAGVGSVLVFVPQIALAFLLIGLLDMSGYLTRGAFIMDRLMRAVGLEGRAFIPLVASFACAIPGIMATRTIPHSGRRLLTMLIAPLMTCSARLPVYTLLISAFIPNQTIFYFMNLQALVMFGLFLLAIVAGLFMSYFINLFSLQASGSGFLMELPRYRLPDFSALFSYIKSRTLSFLTTAGTLIFIISLVLWALAYFPRSEADILQFALQRAAVPESVLVVTHQKEVDNHEAQYFLEHSYLGRLGKFVEPIFAPLGYDWRLNVGVLSAFAAREVFVSTLSVVFNMSDDDEQSSGLRHLLQTAKAKNGKPMYHLGTAMSLLIFFAFSAQCMSTLATIKRETGTYKWPLVTFAYMTVLAYGSAVIVYQTYMMFFY